MRKTCNYAVPFFAFSSLAKDGGWYHIADMKIGKRESQRLQKRAQIIAIAREHFFEKGFEGASMSAIAAQLGGSKRTLWSYFPSKEELFSSVVEDTAASIRGGIDFSAAGDSPLDQLTHLARTIIERMTAPIAVQMFRLISPMAERNPELVRIFFERGPHRTQKSIAEYMRTNFGDLLWTEDYWQAGDDLVGLAASHFHFESLWGLKNPPTARQKDARARLAAILFLRGYGRDPDALAPIEAQREAEAALAAAAG